GAGGVCAPVGPGGHTGDRRPCGGWDLRAAAEGEQPGPDFDHLRAHLRQRRQLRGGYPGGERWQRRGGPTAALLLATPPRPVHTLAIAPSARPPEGVFP